MIDYISVAIILILLIVDYMRKDKNSEHVEDTIEESKLPPGLDGLPVLGETLQFLRKKGQFFKEKRALFGEIYRTHLFGKPTVRVTGKDNVRKILFGENKIVRHSYPTSVKLLAGPNSLAMSSGLDHDKKRKYLMQFLRTEFVNQHVPSLSVLVMERLEQWCSSPSVDIFKESKTLITELSAKFLISSDIDNDFTQRMVPFYNQFTEHLFTIPLNLPGFGFRKALKAREGLKKIFKEALLTNKDSNKSGFPSVLEAYGASLDEDSFNEDAFLDAVLELLWNASETTSSSAFSAIYLLAKHPQVVEKIKNELKENDVSTSFTDPLTHRHLHSLKYVDLVVREVLRLLPPVGGAYRQAIEEISVGGYIIPKDWTVICGFRETHENDLSSDDPLSFYPERWSEKNGSNIPFYTFGGGKRICPGQAFAKQILKLFIVELVRNVEWAIFNEDCELIYIPTPQPKGVMTAKFSTLRTNDVL